MSNYSNNYSDASFFGKVKNSFKKAGVQLIYNALLLYNVLKHYNTPLLDKAIIVTALGYFICPIDIIPDIIVGLGYTDDLAFLAGAVEKVKGNITDSIIDESKDDLDDLFGAGSQRLVN